MVTPTWLHSPIFQREQGRSELHDSLLVGRDCCAHLFADTLLCADAVKRCLHSTGRDLEPGSHDVLQADQLPTHHLQSCEDGVEMRRTYMLWRDTMEWGRY